jgi:hypothetical protein
MDFYAVLDQVIALLRSRGRVSYRALKRQFDLDDAYLDDLKAKIIEVQQLAVDQEREDVRTNVASAVPGDLNADGFLALGSPPRKGLTGRPMDCTAMRHAPGETWWPSMWI